MGFHNPRVCNDAIKLPGRRRTVSGRTDGLLIHDRMMIHFPADAPMRPGDGIVLRAPNGELLDMFFGSVRPDGCVSVWYAVHPELRHWLGWLQPADATTWRFCMEPFHRDWLRELQLDHPDVFGSAS